MRYVLISMALGLVTAISGCTSDNIDYTGITQPNYYFDEGGLPFTDNGYYKQRYYAGPRYYSLRHIPRNEWRKPR